MNKTKAHLIPLLKKLLFALCLVLIVSADITDNNFEKSTPNQQITPNNTLTPAEQKAKTRQERIEKRTLQEDQLEALPDHLTGYRPIYYIEGIRTTEGVSNAMINLSFKYRFIDECWRNENTNIYVS